MASPISDWLDMDFGKLFKSQVLTIKVVRTQKEWVKTFISSPRKPRTMFCKTKNAFLTGDRVMILYIYGVLYIRPTRLYFVRPILYFVQYERSALIFHGQDIGIYQCHCRVQKCGSYCHIIQWTFDPIMRFKHFKIRL